MRPVSDRLQRIVSSSHTAKARVREVHDFPQTVTPANAGPELKVLDGSVRMESGAEVRATLELTVDAPWGSIIPDGRELFVEYGVQVAGGAYEWVSLGYFGVVDVEQSEINGPLRVTAADRMARLAGTSSPTPLVAPANATVYELFRQLQWGLAWGAGTGAWGEASLGAFPHVGTQDLEPTLTIFDSGLGSSPLGLAQVLDDRNYAQIAWEVARNKSRRLFYDYRGCLNVVSQYVLPDAEPVASINAGNAGSLSSMRRLVSREGAYTAAQASSSAPMEGQPVWDSAFMGSPKPGAVYNDPWFTDNDFINSPKRRKFGLQTVRVSRPDILTYADATTAAAYALYQSKGLPYSLSLTCVPNPGLEPLDTIEIRFPDGGMPGLSHGATTEKHVIDALTFPLTGGAMTIETRGGWIRP